MNVQITGKFLALDLYLFGNSCFGYNDSVLMMCIIYLCIYFIFSQLINSCVVRSITFVTPLHFVRQGPGGLMS